jgi:hypothetical protein
MPQEEYSVKLGFKGSEFKRGIQMSREEVKALEKQVAETEKRFQKFRDTAAKVALATGAFFKGVVDRADNIKDLSDKFGVFSESLQKVGLVAEQNGSSLEGVASAMNKLEIARDKALAGDAAIIANFKELGISMDDLKSMGADEIMAKIGKGAMNAAPMVAVMGKNALELRDTLSQLEGAKVSGIISDEDIQNLGAFHDQVAEIWRTLQQWGAAIATGFMTDLRDAAAMASAFVDGIQAKMAGGNFSETAKKSYADQKAFDTWKVGQVNKPRIRSDEDIKPPNYDRTNRILDQRTSANETREAAIKDARDSEYQKIRDKMRSRAGMSGLEIANAKRDERREKLAQERGDRRFAKKYGAEYLQELKDRQDPVKQAEAAFSKAMAKSEAELQKITGELATTNQLLGNIEAPTND